MHNRRTYRYETHLHTYPVSKCAHKGVREALLFYKKLGYDGVFITNHFIDGNINMDRSSPYEALINFYFSDYEEGVKIGEEIGISVFCGVELSYKGTDFLVYGLDKEWFLSHSEICDMKKSQQLQLFRDNGALVIQAHPFREASYIDHIRLFPRCVDGVEIYNGGCTEFENEMAERYADQYSLLHFSGTDFHGVKKKYLCGIETQKIITDVNDFVDIIKSNKAVCFKE